MEQWTLSREAIGRPSIYCFFPFLQLILIQPTAAILEGTDANKGMNQLLNAPLACP